MSTAADYQNLPKDVLINKLLDLQAENHALSRQLRSSRGSVHRGSEQLSGSLHGNSPTQNPLDSRTNMSPAAARLSTTLGASQSRRFTTNSPPPKQYEISMNVMVIENGSAISLPMSCILDKTYGREDMRDADTPVVSGRFLRDGSSSPQGPGSKRSSIRYSIGTGGLEASLDMNLEEELVKATANDGVDEEPSPEDPSKSIASSLAKRAGVKQLNLQEGIFNRDMSLDADAMISLQTLRLFNQQYTRDCLSPVSSYGNAVYHYVVKTFAVENGCQHLPDDVEGFGRTLISLCSEMTRILSDEPRHGSIVSPCYVFGDLHGNFRDLFYFMDNLISFQDLRYTPHRFLFLGDYVDRGEFSVEVIAYLFSMKVLAPNKILLLRGNHEDTLVSGDISGYGNTSFRAQCHSVFGSALGEQVWRTCSGVFALLPLTANIDQKIYCTHGGIPRFRGGADDRLDLLKSPDFPIMESFFQVPENETPQHQTFRQVGMDTCWADPAENESKLDEWGFGSNPRGTGVILFGSKAVDDFLDHFGFEYIFRAHQEKSDGLKLSKNARVFTIFSTSAYVGHSNGAGVVLVADNKIRLIVKCADTFEDEEDMYDEDA